MFKSDNELRGALGRGVCRRNHEGEACKEDDGDDDDGDDNDNCQKTATEEETGVAAWVSAAVLCAFGESS